MTTIYKVVVVPEHTENREIRTNCDICGNNVEPLSLYDTDEVTISRRVGKCYPDYNSGNDYNYHMCGKCFEEKLQPFLASLGMPIISTEYDY